MITKNWGGIILSTLRHYANSWKLQEETAKQWSESEASLYKYKRHTHVIESDSKDDVIDHMFPDYEVEFNQNDDNIESMDCHDKSEESLTTATTSACTATVSVDVMVEVCAVHLLSSKVSVDHIPLLSCSQYKPSLMLGYQLAGSLAKQLKTLPGTLILQ